MVSRMHPLLGNGRGNLEIEITILIHPDREYNLMVIADGKNQTDGQDHWHGNTTPEGYLSLH